MIHLITVAGKSARKFYLEQHCISDFKSLMRTVTSGRVMIVSTKFRSDLFYTSDKPNNTSILKLWAFYTNSSLSNESPDFMTSIGADNSFSEYFQSINALSSNWYHYKLYKKAFLNTYLVDPQNPVTNAIILCDQYLTEHPSIKRLPLIDSLDLKSSELIKDTFSLAMRIINNESHSN